MDCWQLEKLALPAKTLAIGPRAFQGCINLYQIKLNKALEYVGTDAFDDCESLEAILIPRGSKAKFKSMLPNNLHKLLEEV